MQVMAYDCSFLLDREKIFGLILDNMKYDFAQGISVWL